MNQIELIEKRLGLSPDEIEARDQARVERADRLARFIRGEAVGQLWVQDFLPLLESLYGRYHRAALAGDQSALGGCRALEDLVAAVGGAVDLGRSAFRRIAQRRLGGQKENLGVSRAS